MEFVNISKLFSSEYYSVPDYQRDYEWGVPENTTLMDDIFELTLDQDSTHKHFIGAIVTVKYEESNGVNKSIDFDEYSITKPQIRHVVDGQQRLTSISLMISALRDIISDDQTIITNIKDNLTATLSSLLLGNSNNFRITDYSKPPRIILNGNTGVCYNNDILHVRPEVPNRKYRGAKHLLAIRKLYFEGIQKKKQAVVADHLFENSTAFYLKLVQVITTRLTLVEITCDDSSNAFQVFDSLNGKGLDLTAADRIKNIMLSWAKKEDKGAQKWDSLVELTTEGYLANYFVTLFFYNCSERVSKNKLPEKFKDYYKESAQGNYGYFFTVLKETATLYGDLRLNKTENPEINEMLKDLQQLNLDQVYVLLFAAAYRYGKETIRSDEYKELVLALTSLVVRMQICNMSMNKLDILFKKCINAMKEGNQLPQITQLVKQEKESITDSQFIESFKKFSTTDNKVSEFYLRHIENLMRKQAGIRGSVIRNLTVEHIIPQTLDDISSWYGSIPIPIEIEEDFKMEVQQNIGNKALLYGDDNSSAGNETYPKKLYIYRNGKRGQDQGTPESTFRMISDLIAKYPNQFTHTEVIQRAKELASYAAQIW